MIAQAKDPTLAMRCPSPLVLFGIDNRGKPELCPLLRIQVGSAANQAAAGEAGSLGFHGLPPRRFSAAYVLRNNRSALHSCHPETRHNTASESL